MGVSLISVFGGKRAEVRSRYGSEVEGSMRTVEGLLVAIASSDSVGTMVMVLVRDRGLTDKGGERVRPVELARVGVSRQGMR